MTKIKKALLSLAAAGLASAAQATPVSFDSVAFNPNGGYGRDGCEICGTALDVRFTSAAFSPQQFGLAAGQSQTFAVGTVNFQEPETYGGIRSAETDNLGIKAFLGFTGPNGQASLLKFKGIGTAYAGAINDADVDYTLTWEPRQIRFGSQGLLEISFGDLSFTGIGSQTLMATVTLLQSGSVPEPGTMALFGLGLAGLGVIRRRKSA